MGMRYSLKGGIVAKGQTVDPKAPAGGGLTQPPYSRGAHNNQTSKELISHQQCVAEGMANYRGGDRQSVRNAFRARTKECAGRTVY